MKKKTNRGTLINWQLHHLSTPQELIDEVYPGVNAKPLLFTGTITKDPSGKRRPNDHMRSSLIVKIDMEKMVIETINSYYKIVGEEGGDIFSDLGDTAMTIYY